MNYKLYFRADNEGDARLLRAFGETPEPRFPAEIEGRAITEIGDYCFAAQAHLPGRMPVQLSMQEETGGRRHRRQRRTGRCRRSREQTVYRRQRAGQGGDVMPGSGYGAPGAEPEQTVRWRNWQGRI